MALLTNTRPRPHCDTPSHTQQPQQRHLAYQAIMHPSCTEVRTGRFSYKLSLFLQILFIGGRGLSYALIRCFLCNHFIKCLCNLCEKNNKTFRIRSQGCLLLAEPSTLQLLLFGVSWCCWVSHRCLSLRDIWGPGPVGSGERKEGDKQREGRAEERRESQALLGQLVLERRYNVFCV